jgi:hypothetical protein
MSFWCAIPDMVANGLRLGVRAGFLALPLNRNR